ncbi:MAG: hypothetical protein JW829_11895 [Pirellulales bacterium]|nr:hypothetical protein [Pirellulales bacterium]
MPRQYVAQISSIDGSMTNGSGVLSGSHWWGSREFPDPIAALKSIFHAALYPSWALILIASMAGCGPRLSDQELGHIEYRLPEVPGADVPYPLPDLTVIEEKEGASEESSESLLKKGEEPVVEEADEATLDGSDP